MIDKSKRVQQKSGKDDEGTTWACARLNQCVEWKKKIQVGIDSGDVKDMNYAVNLKPIHLDGIESIPIWILFFHSMH